MTLDAIADVAAVSRIARSRDRRVTDRPSTGGARNVRSSSIETMPDDAFDASAAKTSRAPCGLPTRARALALASLLACHRDSASDGHAPVAPRPEPPDVAREASAPLDAPSTIAPADAPLLDAGRDTSACASAHDLALDLAPGATPFTPAIDLDGDGVADPIYTQGDGSWMIAFLYVERAGCGRAVGTVQYSLSGALTVTSRSKSGWAVLLGRTVHTFDESEQRAEYDGNKYRVEERSREWSDGRGVAAARWSAWSRVP